MLDHHPNKPQPALHILGGNTVATYVMLWFQDDFMNNNQEPQAASTPEPESSAPEPPFVPRVASQDPNRTAPPGERPPRDELAS